MLTNFCRLKGLVSWEVTARDAGFWKSLLPEFPTIYPTLCDLYIRSSDYVCSFYPCAWNRLPNVACRVDLDLVLACALKGCLLWQAGVTHSLFCFCPRGASFGPASVVFDFDSLSGYLEDLAGCVTQTTIVTQPPHPCTWLVVNKLASSTVPKQSNRYRVQNQKHDDGSTTRYLFFWHFLFAERTATGQPNRRKFTNDVKTLTCGQRSTLHAPLGSLFQAQWENMWNTFLYTSALAAI